MTSRYGFESPEEQQAGQRELDALAERIGPTIQDILEDYAREYMKNIAGRGSTHRLLERRAEFGFYVWGLDLMTAALNNTDIRVRLASIDGKPRLKVTSLGFPTYFSTGPARRLLAVIAERTGLKVDS